MGSLCWCAPELFANTDAASPACDVYSYGILCWEILQASTPPYMDLDKPWKIRDFVQGGGRPSLDEVPAEWHDFVQMCWSGISKQRPNFDAVLTHLYQLEKTAPGEHQ